MKNSVCEQPREKLARNGARSLTNTELLQVIIGSGSAQASVSKIAKKVAKVLSKSGSFVHPQELLGIKGVGHVKAGQILALFELAARFPAATKSAVYADSSSFKEFYKDIPNHTKQHIVYATFDGAYRLIRKREIDNTQNTSVVKVAQRVFADSISDSATSLFVAIGHAHQELEPNLRELTIIREINKTAHLLSIHIRQIILVSKTATFAVKESHL